MLIDAPKIVENSSIINATVPNGDDFPPNENIGELFYRTTPGISGLYMYSGNTWNAIGLNANGGAGSPSSAELIAHIADQQLHITSAQNAFLDGIVVAFGEVNALSGLTSFLGTTSLPVFLNSLMKKDGSTPLSNNLNADGFKITNVGAPSAPADAVNKKYVDNLIQANWVAALAGRTLI